MNKILRLSIPIALSLVAAILVAGVASANQEVKPVFNHYESVNLHYGVGPESDFLRLGKSGELGNKMEVCEDGQTVDLWFYVHNSEAEEHNGDDLSGPGVATGTTVSVLVDEKVGAKTHEVSGVIDSDQTEAISDSISIYCDDNDIRLTYDKESYLTKAAGKKDFNNFSLTGDIREGALLGYSQGETKGIVPGCWDYRARINVQLTVNVIEQEEEEELDDDEEEEKEKEEEEKEEEEPDITDLGPNTNMLLTVLILGISTASAFGYRAYLQRR